VLDLPPVLPLVSADADRVLQVLANLLSNARKFSPGGGEVTLAARPLEGAVEVSVRDRGLGLPPEAVPRLFEKFYRVDNSDRREIKGTGLGLAICRQIIEAHGGEIGVESEGLGTGARFRFTLPTVSPVVGSGDRLVVEDDSGFARLLEEVL
ncbi:MAG TPA: ATP-binding protein, partial [Chloroflexota bacterium]